MKNVIPFAGAALALAFALPGLPAAAEEAEPATGGTWHDLTWTLEDHTLIVSGEGELAAETDRLGRITAAPDWSTHADEIYDIILTDGITGIGSRALAGYPHLQQITLPASLTDLSPYALSDNPELSAIDGIGNVETFHFACLSGTAYIAEHPFIIRDGRLYYAEGTDLNVPEGVTEIMPFAFGNLTGETYLTYADGRFGAVPVTVMLPEGVEIIHDNAFAFCAGLTEIELPDSVTSIGAHAFYDCVRLQSLTLGENVESVGEQALFNCKSLEVLTVSNPETVLSEEAYGLCYNWERAIEARHNDEGPRRMSDAQYEKALADLAADPYCLDTELAAFAVHFPETKPYSGISFSSTLLGISDPANLYTAGTIRGYADSTAQGFAEQNALAFEPIEPPLPGDVNLDGVVDIMDVIRLNRYLLGAQTLTQRERMAADFDTNDHIDETDSLSILRYVVGMR